MTPRDLVKMLMTSQGWEVIDRPSPAVVHDPSRARGAAGYNPESNTIFLGPGTGLADYAHELCHSLQDADMTSYVGPYDVKAYMAQECERQAYAVSEFLRGKINGRGRWSTLGHRPGRKLRLEINQAIKEVRDES